MAKGLADDFNGLVLVFQRHGKTVAGGIDCYIPLTFREVQFLCDSFEGSIETLTNLDIIDIFGW